MHSNRIAIRIATILSAATLVAADLSCTMTAYAADEAVYPVTSTDTIGLSDITEQEQAMADYRRTLEIQSNLMSSWPTGPAVSAEAAIVMDADTGTILYAKNIHENLSRAGDRDRHTYR